MTTTDPLFPLRSLVETWLERAGRATEHGYYARNDKSDALDVVADELALALPDLERAFREKDDKLVALVQERDALRSELDKIGSLRAYFLDSVGECHLMISRNTSEFQIRREWEATDLPPRVQKIMQRAEQAEARVQRLQEALLGILELGRSKPLDNPKYDGYFEAARAALAQENDHES